MTSSLSLHTNTLWFPQTHSGSKTSVRLCGYEFSVHFHFYSPFSSLSHPSCSFSLFSCLIVFHFSPLYYFSFKLPAFLLLSHSHIGPSVSSLRQAVFIFQSFISTNVRQCFCPPSIDPQREEEMKREVGEQENGNKSRGGTERRNETEGEKKAGWKMWQWGLICTLFSFSLFSISIPPYGTLYQFSNRNTKLNRKIAAYGQINRQSEQQSVPDNQIIQVAKL